MRRAANASESDSNFSLASGRRWAGGLAGPALAIFIGFVEAAALRGLDWATGESAAGDAPCSDDGAQALVSAASGQPHATVDQMHKETPSATVAAAEHAFDDQAAAPANHLQSGDADDQIAGESGSFWFDAQGLVHTHIGADDSAGLSADGVTALSEESAGGSGSGATTVFTAAEPISFQYGGASVLNGSDAAHGSGTDLLDAHLTFSTSALTNCASEAAQQFADNFVSSAPVFASSTEHAVVEDTATSIAASLAATAVDANSPHSAPVLQAWNGDIGAGYTASDNGGGSASGGTSTVAPTGATDGSGLVINLVFDSSVANAPAGFVQAVEAVAAFYESTFDNPVSITIDVGYGEVDGQPLSGLALGESQAYLTEVSYAQLQAALAANANSIGVYAAAASLAATSPVNGDYWIPTAEAEALGIIGPSDGINGYVGFSSIPTLFDYNTTNNSGAVPGYQYDFFGVVAHEFSEVMGRQMMDGEEFAGAPGYEPLDLFHYSAPGIRDFSGTTAGYISANGGNTSLGELNTNPNGDFGDWASGAGNDSFNAYSAEGALNPVTANDIAVMNLLGWDSAPPAPVVTAPPTDAYDAIGGTVTVSSAQAATQGVLANASDTASGATLSVTAVDGSAADVGTAVDGTFGVLTLNADGSYTYQNTDSAAVAAMGGVAEDVFNFTVSDGHGDTTNSTLTVLITSPGDTLITGSSDTTIQAGADGGGAPNVLDGIAGDMTLVAGSGPNVLVGGPGDTLIGGKGNDTFMFGTNFGDETIESFRPRHDVIELPQSEFANFAAVKADMTYSDGNTYITLDANDVITLTNVNATHLHAHNFSFIV